MKSLAYKIFKNKLTDELINVLTPIFLKVQNLKKEKEKHPFYIAVTVDTEPGYINNDLTRKWMSQDFQGCYSGIKILRELASKHNAKLTFLLCTQCFTAKGDELKKIINQLKRSYKAKHEIGLHLHPRRDLALQKEINKELKYASAKFYSEENIIEMLNAQRNLIKKNLGEKIEKSLISFRWGNWALDTKAIKALEKTSFKIDTSAVPRLKGHIKDDRTYDWKNTKTHYPWFLSSNNYQDTKEQNSKVLEIPIATFKFLGINFRADPFLSNSLLINCFKYYYKNADRSEKPFIFVVITHSSEAVYENGKKSYVVNNLEQFFRYCSKFNDLKFVTLKEAYDKYIT